MRVNVNNIKSQESLLIPFRKWLPNPPTCLQHTHTAKDKYLPEKEHAKSRTRHKNKKPINHVSLPLIIITIIIERVSAGGTFNRYTNESAEYPCRALQELRLPRNSKLAIPKSPTNTRFSARKACKPRRMPISPNNGCGSLLN